MEANPFLHGLGAVLDQVFDNVRVIHVVRHPADYIRSHINHGVFVGAKGLAGRFCPFWLLKPDYYEPAPERRWGEMAREERLAWRWVVINQMIEEAAAVLGDRYTRIRYEDLFEPSGTNFRALVRWLEIEGSACQEINTMDHRYNASRVQRASPYADWPESTVLRVLQQVAPLMGRYGYTIDGH